MTELHARSLAGLGLVLLVLGVTANGQVHQVGPLSIDSVIVLVPIAILMCLPYVRRKGIAMLPSYLFGPAVLVFLACGLFSVILNGGHLASLLTIVRYAAYFVLTMTVAVATQDAAVRRLLLWTIGATGGLSAVLALAQYADPQLTPGMHGISAEITTRVVATFYNSNFYAEYLMLVVGVLIALIFTEGRFGRLTAALASIIVALALLFTYTRGSWIGLFVGLAVLALIVDFRYLLAIPVIGIAGILLVPGVRVRIAQADSGSATFRLGLWKVAGEAMRRHPFFGYGPGDFLAAYREVVITRTDLFAGYLGFGAHNSYFELGAEIGVLGAFAFFVVTVVYATRGLYIGTRKGADPYTRHVALGLSVGLVGFIVNTFTSNTFQHPQSGLFFWILAGIVGGLGTGLWQQELREEKLPAVSGTGLLGGSTGLAWLANSRRWVESAWRSSLALAETAQPRPGRSGWFESSVAMRLLFGSGPGKTPEGG